MSTTEEKGSVHYGVKCIDRINEKRAAGEKFFSIEFYPPRTEKGIQNLKKSLSAMVKWRPQWMDVTWGAGGVTSDLTPKICNYIQNTARGNCMMHLTCTNMPSEKVDIALKQAKDYGFKNILALRGDPPEGQEKWEAVEGGFKCALDLVKYIREQYGDYFGITVAGYPEGHPTIRTKIAAEDVEKSFAVHQLEDGSFEGVSAANWAKELDYLKAKCTAGAQVIITQLFYDADTFIDWVKAVRAHGITAPIMPGIMPIRGYASFFRFTGFCKTVIPKELRAKLEQLKDDKDALYAYGCEYVSAMCHKILRAQLLSEGDVASGLHIYSMNTEKCTIELLNKCKEILCGADDELKRVISAEYERVLAEDMAAKLAKEERQRAKLQEIQKSSPSERGEFKEITSM